jgi:hypothetical protein
MMPRGIRPARPGGVAAPRRREECPAGRILGGGSPGRSGFLGEVGGGSYGGDGGAYGLSRLA